MRPAEVKIITSPKRPLEIIEKIIAYEKNRANELLNKPLRRGRVWTAEQKAAQAAKIRAWQPWARSTGPKTDGGKARASYNAYKHGGCTAVSRSLNETLRAQARFMREIGARRMDKSPASRHKDTNSSYKESHSMLRRNRQTKIVATMGPASNNLEMIRKLFVAGVDVFRLNFSHGTHADHKERLEMIRSLEKEFGRPTGVIADLQGPKNRIGKFANDRIELKEGMSMRFDLDKTPGDETRVNLPHPEVIAVMAPGSEILLDDGKVRVKITEQGGDFLVGTVMAGTKLSNTKGFNVPGVYIPVPAR